LGKVTKMIDYKDLAERSAATFIQATVATLSVDQALDMGAAEWKLLAASGFAAVLSMVKGYVASRFGADTSCSLIRPKNKDEELAEMFGDEETQ
jgi:Na+(H+)/acetate symporter ActP